MATTINSYSVALGLNTQGVIDGSKLARKEVRELTKIFQEQENDMEKYAKKLDVLEKAYKSGAIQQDAYEESVKRLQARMRDTKDIDKHKTSVDSASTSLATYAKQTIAAYVGLQTLSAGFRNVINRIDEIDSLAEKATGLDESVGRIQAYQFALKKLAGIEGPQALNLLEQMTRRIGDNELGTGKSTAALSRLGVTLDELKGKSPIEQFELLAGEIQKLDSRTEKAAVANKLFGTSASELMPVLMSTQQEYKTLLADSEKFGLSLKDYDVAKLQMAQDSLDEMHFTYSGIANVASVELAPAISDVSSMLAQMADSLRPLVSVVGTLTSGLSFVITAGSQFASNVGGGVMELFPGDGKGINLERMANRLTSTDEITGFLDKRYQNYMLAKENQSRLEESQRQRQNLVRPIQQQQPGNALENKETAQQLKALTALQARLGQQQLQMQAETNRRLAQLEFAKRVR